MFVYKRNSENNFDFENNSKLFIKKKNKKKYIYIILIFLNQNYKN